MAPARMVVRCIGVSAALVGIAFLLGAGDVSAQTWTTTPAPPCDTFSRVKVRDPNCAATWCMQRGRCFTNLGSWGPHPTGQKQKYYVYDSGCLRLACTSMRRPRR